MAVTNRLLIQSSQMTMRKEKEDENFALLIDLPADASLVVHDFGPYDDEQAWVKVSVVEIVDQYDDEDPGDIKKTLDG